jgi:hypothetical protein
MKSSSSSTWKRSVFFRCSVSFSGHNNPHAQGETMINDQEQVISNEVSIEEAEERESKDSLKTLKLDVRSLCSVTGTGYAVGD